MPPPRTIADIKDRREAARRAAYKEVLDQLDVRAASLSDPAGHTTVINVPLPPAVLTVVSWNVQTFEAGKSMGSPFVNKVINRVLEALDADICVLLETRADSAVNMNAIETGHVGASGWKQGTDEEDDEEDAEELPDDDDDGPELVEDDDDEAPSDPRDGGEPLTYAQNVSEMTGKRWAPPKVIHVYDPVKVVVCRDVRDLTRIHTLQTKLQTKGKITAKEQKALTTLIKRRDKKLLADAHHYDAARAASAGLRSFASGYNFHPKLNKALCVSAGNPSLDWRAVLAAGESLPLRTYYELQVVRDDWSETVVPWDQPYPNVGPDWNWRFLLRLRRCPSCGESLGAGGCAACADTGPYTTMLENLRQAVDAVTFYMCTCQESYSILLRQETEVLAGSDRGQWMDGKLVSAKTVAARLLMRAPDILDKSHGKVEIQSGPLLGYQDKTVGFYGRCPYLLPLELWLPYRDISHKLYLVAFHAPYGASTLAGVELRAAAMRELLNAGVGQGSKLGAEPDVMIIGDFNLDWAPDAHSPSGQQRIAGELYDHMAKNGLAPLIDGGAATSLKSIHGRAAWKDIRPVSEEFTSSAYDNCFLRGDDVRRHVVNAAVVDVISWIEDNLAEFDLPADDPQRATFGALPTKTRAFYIYRKYVSDHLPIVCDILVAPMTPRSRALAARARAEADLKEQARRVMIDSVLARRSPGSRFDSVWLYEQVELCDYASEGPDAYLILSDDGRDRVALFRGTIAYQADDHLVLRCEVQPGQVAWVAWRPQMRPKQLAMMLRAFPPGKRVEWHVKNPKPT